MPTNPLARLARIELAPPRYLAFPTAGVDISVSGVKVAILEERLHGLELLVHRVVESFAVVFGEFHRPAGGGGRFFHRGCWRGLGFVRERMLDQPDAAAQGQQDQDKRGAGRR